MVDVSEFPLDMRLFWYPICPSENLLAGDVVGLHILGDPICLYRELKPCGKGKAVCISDRCAHRSAPLSIGNQLNGEGRLECKYHGWQYDSEGRVVEIPALLEGRDIPVNARVHVYPLVERDGFIWIWAGSSDMADPNLIPTISPGDNVKDAHFHRPFVHSYDLDCDHSLMVENLLDPAHIPFTHDGTIGRRSRAHPLQMSAQSKPAPQWAYQNLSADALHSHNLRILQGTQQVTPADRRLSSNFYFLPPCHVLIKTEFSPGTHFHQTMHCIPLRPGHMRLIYTQSMSTAVAALNFAWPLVWHVNEWMSEKIVFQDYALLHGQQVRMRQGSKLWHTPIQVDTLPKYYRQWLHKALNSSRAHTRAVEDLKQDDYLVVLAERGPYFKGWKSASTNTTTTTNNNNNSNNKELLDIEDLGDGVCRDECGIGGSGSSLDDDWYIPHQRGINNSAYTWRRNLLLRRNAERSSIAGYLVGDGMFWTCSFLVAAASLAYYTFKQ